MEWATLKDFLKKLFPKYEFTEKEVLLIIHD
jgi:hypothetical protein